MYSTQMKCFSDFLDVVISSWVTFIAFISSFNLQICQTYSRQCLIKIRAHCYKERIFFAYYSYSDLLMLMIA